MKRILLLVFVWGQIFSQINVVGNQITADKLKEHITILASDSLEGREVGQPGEELAAEYMSNYFNHIGIPPYKDSTYYQEIPLEKRVIESVNIKIGGDQYDFKDDRTQWTAKGRAGDYEVFSGKNIGFDHTSPRFNYNQVFYGQSLKFDVPGPGQYPLKKSQEISCLSQPKNKYAAQKQVRPGTF